MFSRLRIPIAAVAISAVAIAATPGQASAVAPPTCTMNGSVLLGFGGYFSGCWTTFTVTRYFENAGDVSNMNYFTGVPTRDPVTNAPTPSGTFLFDNDCGSSGHDATTGVFCSTSLSTFGWSNDNELVFGLNNLSKGTWLYSGTDPNRNNPPAPAGVQNWLWRVQGGAWDGWYLFGWEDLNSGCISALSNSGSNNISNGTIIDGTQLGASLVNCQASNYPGYYSDNDYNDFYFLIQPYQDPSTHIVPEPMTMTLLATGLLGMGGASVARRRRQR